MCVNEFPNKYSVMTINTLWFMYSSFQVLFSKVAGLISTHVERMKLWFWLESFRFLTLLGILVQLNLVGFLPRQEHLCESGFFKCVDNAAMRADSPELDLMLG